MCVQLKNHFLKGVALGFTLLYCTTMLCKEWGHSRCNARCSLACLVTIVN